MHHNIKTRSIIVHRAPEASSGHHGEKNIIAREQTALSSRRVVAERRPLHVRIADQYLADDDATNKQREEAEEQNYTRYHDMSIVLFFV